MRIAEVEKRNESRIKIFFHNLCNNSVFKKTKNVIWKCNNCGYIIEGLEAPEICPTCAHPKVYFEVFVEAF